MTDRILLERLLSDIKSNIRDLREASDITWEIYHTDKRARRFVERTLHITIEACLDTAHHIISDEQFREPSSYRETFAILSENSILAPEDLERFHKMASFRNLLVHYYERIDDSIVYGIFRNSLGDFELFVERITAYLAKQEEIK